MHESLYVFPFIIIGIVILMIIIKVDACVVVVAVVIVVVVIVSHSLFPVLSVNHMLNAHFPQFQIFGSSIFICFLHTCTCGLLCAASVSLVASPIYVRFAVYFFAIAETKIQMTGNRDTDYLHFSLRLRPINVYTHVIFMYTTRQFSIVSFTYMMIFFSLSLSLLSFAHSHLFDSTLAET